MKKLKKNSKPLLSALRGPNSPDPFTNIPSKGCLCCKLNWSAFLRSFVCRRSVWVDTGPGTSTIFGSEEIKSPIV
ncbi:hypothetical protein J6590_006320 [Homalodisca vitripennis]|nr:hypothetical protein J6590_006320 [Homalodisca vitripennis]